MILVAQNLLIFFRHYFAGYGFPWDFIGSYYAAPAFWTEAARHGGVPSWMPYQWFGYPFFLNMQAGLFYPPLWLFPVLHVPYTLASAVRLQCLHVLLGAVGMYAFLRVRVGSRREALLGAFAYQFFGGFYSNAEHVDIVRSFALIPWLLAAAGRRGSDADSFSRRLWLLPVVVFFLATGGYPGSFLAALFLLAVFLAVQIADDPAPFRRPATLAQALLAAALIGCGLLMAAVQLGPAFLFRDQLARYHGAAKVGMANLGFAHLPGLFLTGTWMPGDISMSSTYVGITIVAVLFLLPLSRWRAQRSIAIVGIVAAFMAAGPSFPFYRVVSWLFPPLGFSRFPSSDYRPWVAIAMITLAAAALQSLRHFRIAARRLAIGWAFFGALFVWGIASVYRAHWNAPAIVAPGVCLAISVAALLGWRHRFGAPWMALAVLLAAMSLDGARVLDETRNTWSVADLLGYCRRSYPVPATVHDRGEVVAAAVLHGVRGARPARMEIGVSNYRASGYLIGTYNGRDFGNLVFETRRQISSTPWMMQYMLREWVPILQTPEAVRATGPRSIEIPSPGSLPATGADPRVRQTFYGLDHIRYEVNLESPMWLVENETDFPGWRASLSSGQVIAARRANGALRSWLLPAGRYEMEARFRLPGFPVCAGASAAAWIAFLFGVTVAIAHRRSVRVQALVASFGSALLSTDGTERRPARSRWIVPVAAVTVLSLVLWGWTRLHRATAAPAKPREGMLARTVAPAQPSFEDVSPNEPSARLIVAAVELGAMRECQPARFCPDAVVSRGAAADAVVQVLGKDAETSDRPLVNFRDVSVGTSQGRAIAKLASRGAAVPCGPGLYCPDSPITRAVLVRMILLARHGADFRPPAPSGLFRDLPPGDPQAGWAEAAAREGLTAGCGTGRFCPEAFVTRRQMAILIVAASTSRRSRSPVGRAR